MFNLRKIHEVCVILCDFVLLCDFLCYIYPILSGVYANLFSQIPINPKE
jgi:hypothetical protein